MASSSWSEKVRAVDRVGQVLRTASGHGPTPLRLSPRPVWPTGTLLPEARPGHAGAEVGADHPPGMTTGSKPFV